MKKEYRFKVWAVIGMAIHLDDLDEIFISGDRIRGKKRAEAWAKAKFPKADRIMLREVK